ncbi:nucleotidyl transferase AbiEii/AbiGii toxin family protein [Candidatus Peregrinibacteria bacterium]|nr:nucleotidyl transferase AbiEii/AbiGii toxin family protein [Candidatus Peregrinibacteria bacterium]
MKKVLTERQIKLLKEFGKQNFFIENFYLSRGTALAGFYFFHRYSEDLDFFSEDEVNSMQIIIFLKSIKDKFTIKKIDFAHSYNRNLFFLHFDDEVLKMEFTYYPFLRVEKGVKKFGFSIDSLLDIAINKLFTIYQRSKARDYIDLYCICQKEKFAIDGLIKIAKIKFDWHIDPIQLGTQFIKAHEVEDYPRMIQKLNKKDWQDFFMAEAKKLGPNILK